VGRDIVFTWNGTTSGVRVPDGDWIKPNRQGLTICDATSPPSPWTCHGRSSMSSPIPGRKCWGGEAAHGMLVLSPRAVARLESYTPAWPLPKLFRLTSKGQAQRGRSSRARRSIRRRCSASRTRSTGCAGRKTIGGLPALIRRAEDNTAAIAAWVERTPWIRFLAASPRIRSCTSVCLAFTDPAFAALFARRRRPSSSRNSPPSSRRKASPTISPAIATHRRACGSGPGAPSSAAILEALLPWLDWAYGELRQAQAA